METYPGYSILKAFNAIDTYGFNFIDHVSLTRFMKNNITACTQAEIQAIIRRLDLCANSKVNFKEFSNAMSPFEPYFCSQNKETSDNKYISEIRDRDFYYYYNRYPYSRYPY